MFGQRPGLSRPAFSVGVTIPPLARLNYMGIETAKRILERRRLDKDLQRAARGEAERLCRGHGHVRNVPPFHIAICE